MGVRQQQDVQTEKTIQNWSVSPARALDLVAAASLACLIASWAFKRIAYRLEWYDWLCYALPAANLVERGTFGSPQLGSIDQLDKAWLFNGPVMALGAFPFYELLHVGRVPYLIGVWVGFALGAIVIVAAIHRSGASKGWLALSIFLAFGLLGHRGITAELDNQRYSCYSVPLLAIAFGPWFRRNGAIPWYRWAAAAALPLVHSILLLGSCVWALFVGASLLRSRKWRENRAGLVAFAFVVIVNAAWLLHPSLLRDQFLPHSRGMVKFHETTTEAIPALLMFKLPPLGSKLMIGVVAVLVASCSFFVVRPSGQGAPADPILSRMAPALILLVCVMGAFTNFWYAPLFYVPVALGLLLNCDTRGRLRAASYMLAIASLANAGIAIRFERQVMFSPLRLVDQKETVDFVIEHTRPGDRIVLAPPFVLASVSKSLPEGRVVVGDTPACWITRSLDVNARRDQLREASDVFVGDPRWFGTHMQYDLPALLARIDADKPLNFADPLYLAKDGKTYDFYSKPVVVYRKANATNKVAH